MISAYQQRLVIFFTFISKNKLANEFRGIGFWNFCGKKYQLPTIRLNPPISIRSHGLNQVEQSAMLPMHRLLMFHMLPENSVRLPPVTVPPNQTRVML